MKLLASIVRDKNEDLLHREAAYQGIPYVNGIHPRQHPYFTEENVDTAVDWDLITRIESGTWSAAG